MSNNYPDGVTENHPHFNQRERVETMWIRDECKMIDTPATRPDGAVLVDDDGDEVYACDFMGEAEIEGELIYSPGSSIGVFYWTCPNGHDNETEVDLEDLYAPDPDRDEWRD